MLYSLAHTFCMECAVICVIVAIAIAKSPIMLFSLSPIPPSEEIFLGPDFKVGTYFPWCWLHRLDSWRQSECGPAEWRGKQRPGGTHERAENKHQHSRDCVREYFVDGRSHASSLARA